MNAKFKREAKEYFEKDFFKLINNSVFRKAMEDMRKYKRFEISNNR